ncbi:DUF1837 domain-containing protein [Mucilaginibacter sp. L3T2-6]|uniref:HamA C-terminal domain-containing protein n=1 Tax=Mucilaginibacter sp. L3T2-6 TaxID=3062491 RepID=UPI0026752425|nr:DUF1837 domain-containing protein [Mucilaginibacter sp. L3T2-6]MDO3641266.1 DUF1837 domain-containing protein [Mucilaginibacter sp. L3T2-6]MDV6213974.1 DUF1837 domain-containing protein [Mucilaginibacter sp. L3T2-6]
MNHVYWVRQEFDVVPKKEHVASCINYVDLQEYRDEFCEELVNTIPEWIYSNQKAAKIVDMMVAEEGRSDRNAQSALRTVTFQKFKNSVTEEVFLQGQFGELILFNLLQVFFDAVPLLRKMPITSSANMERFGADAIHYNFEGGTHLIYIGEAKAYSSSYKFNKAFEEALCSIRDNYKNHRTELKLYIYDDFLDEELVPVAKAYKQGKLSPVEVHLVSIILYNETDKVIGANETEKKASIMKIVTDRTGKIDKNLFDGIAPELLPRFNYIFFPLWEMAELLKSFQRLIGK